MRSLKKNKQKLWYSTYTDQITIYEKDEDGNIKYIDDGEGNQIPIEIGTKAGYSSPVIFYANISMSGGEVNPAEYGFDIGSYEAVIVITDKTLPIMEMSLIWHTTEPTIGIDGMADETTADYSVIAVKPSLNNVKYLLKKVAKER